MADNEQTEQAVKAEAVRETGDARTQFTPEPDEDGLGMRSIAARVCAVKGRMGKVNKDGWNPFGKYNFASVDNVYAATRELMAEECLDFRVGIAKCEPAGDEGKHLWVEAWCGFVTPWEVESPDKRFIMLPNTGPQAFETAVSYISKQYLRQRFQIETGEDGEEAMQKDSQTAPKPAEAPVHAAPTVSLEIRELAEKINTLINSGDREAVEEALNENAAAIAGWPRIWRERLQGKYEETFPQEPADDDGDADGSEA